MPRESPERLVTVVDLHVVGDATGAQLFGDVPRILTVVLGLVGIGLLEASDDAWVELVDLRVEWLECRLFPKGSRQMPPVHRRGFQPKADMFQLTGREDSGHLLAECGNTRQVVGDAKDRHHRPVLEHATHINVAGAHVQTNKEDIDDLTSFP